MKYKSSMNIIHINDTEVFSEAINKLRFPMTVLVVMIHVSPALLTDTISIDDKLYNLIVLWSFKIIPHIAVPLFFFISGYLFFYKVKVFTTHIYISKLRKRIKSLLWPYFLWILIFELHIFAATIIGTLIHGSSYNRILDFFTQLDWHIFWDSRQIGNTFSAPALLQMWYIRNLMILVVISPILNYFIEGGGEK